MQEKIITQKKILCPICRSKITKINPMVKYHVRYEPPLVIFACKFCNFTEYALRNNLNLPFCAFVRNRYKDNAKSRAEKVIAFHEKIGVPI